MGSPLRVIFLALLLGGGIWAWATLRFETELIPILPESLSSVRGLRDFSELVVGENDIQVVPDPALPVERRAELLAKLQPALAGEEKVARVQFPMEDLTRNAGVFAAWILLNAPPETFQKVQAALDGPRVAGRLAEIPEKLSGAVDPMDIVKLQLDPLGLLEELGTGGGFLPAADGQAPSFLIVSPMAPLTDTAADSAMVDALRSRMDATLAPEERNQVLLTGIPVFNAEISRQMRHDILFMVAVAAVLLCACFYGFYRTLRPLGWIMVFQFLAMLSGLVAARLFFGGLNVISMGFASILLGVGMDYCILVYHHFASPDRTNQAVWATLRRGIWFSALVTASAFFVLGLSSFPGLRQLAVLVGFGLLMTALLATWLLPVVLRANPPEAPPSLFRASRFSASWILRSRHLLLAAIALGVAALVVAKPWEKISRLYDSSLESLKPVGSEAFRGQQWLTGLDPSASDAIYILRGKNHDAIRSLIGTFASAANPENPPDLAWSVPSEKNRATNLETWKSGTATDLKRLFAEAGFDEGWSGATLEMVSTLESAASGNTDSFKKIHNHLRGMAGMDGNEAFALVRIPGMASTPVPAAGWPAELDSIEVEPVSWISLTDEVADLAGKDFVRLGFAMLAAIVVLCAIAQKSLRLLALNLLALVLAFCIYVGLLLLTGAALTPLSLISVPLLIGLAIDYSLHILMTLEHESGDLRRTFDHLAAPVVLTGLSASIGFGAPMLTGQPALRNFGLVMDLGVVSSVVACLVFLPCFYMLCRKSRRLTPSP